MNKTLNYSLSSHSKRLLFTLTWNITSNRPLKQMFVLEWKTRTGVKDRTFICTVPLINPCYSQFTKTRTFLKPHDYTNNNHHAQACHFVSLCMFLSYRFTRSPPPILHADCEQRSCTKLNIMMQPRHPLSLNSKCFPSVKNKNIHPG